MNKISKKKISKKVKTNSVNKTKIRIDVFIKGHRDRGEEMRLILCSLGMKNDRGLSFNSVYHHYFLDKKGVVQCMLNDEIAGHKYAYSIDSFYEKFNISQSVLKMKYGR